MSTATATKHGKSQAVRPIHVARIGRVKAAVWANETENGVRHNVTLQRIYVDAEGHWQSTDSFGRDDLLLVGKVASLAHSWIYANAQPAGDSQPAGDASASQEEGGPDLPF